MGWWVIAVAVAVGLVAAFWLRTRWPPPAVFLTLMAAGAGVGWGGLLLRRDPSPGEAVLTVAVLAVLIPFHVRFVVGPFGPPASE